MGSREEVVERLETLRSQLFEALAEAEAAWRKAVVVEGELGEIIGDLRTAEKGGGSCPSHSPKNSGKN